MPLMTIDSIVHALPADPAAAIESLMKSYLNVQHWIVYHAGEKGQPEHLPHLQAVAGQLARELAARLLDAYPAGERVTVDDIETWMELERIAE